MVEPCAFSSLGLDEDYFFQPFCPDGFPASAVSSLCFPESSGRCIHPFFLLSRLFFPHLLLVSVLSFCFYFIGFFSFFGSTAVDRSRGSKVEMALLRIDPLFFQLCGHIGKWSTPLLLPLLPYALSSRLSERSQFRDLPSTPLLTAGSTM